MYSRRTLTALLFAAPLLLLAPGEQAWSQNQTAAPTPVDVNNSLDDDLAKLRKERDDLRNQMLALGEGNTLSDVRLGLEYQIRDLRSQEIRLSDLIDESLDSTRELERLREEVRRAGRNSGQSLGDVAFREAIKALFKKIVGDSTPVGRALGVAEQIARQVIHQSNRAAIRDLVVSGYITHQDLFTLWKGLHLELVAAQTKLQKFEELSEDYRSAVYRVLAKIQDREDALVRARLLDGPASRHAVTGRETDAEGDRQEAIRGAAPPRRTGGVSVSTPKPAKPKPKAQSSKKASPSQARQHETGTSTAVIQLGVGLGLQLLNRGSRSHGQQNQGNNWNR